MILVGKRYFTNRPEKTVYMCVNVNQPTMVYNIGVEEFEQHKFMNDIQNVDIDDNELIITVDGKAQTENMYILGIAADDNLLVCNSTFGIRVMNEKLMHKQGYKIINANYKDGHYVSKTIPLFDCNINRLSVDTFNAFKQRMYDCYCEYINTNKSKRKPKAFDEIDDETWIWLRHIMRTFYTAEYNDWIRLL